LGERPPDAATTFALFFYGTLKRGQINHARFCRGFASAEEATVRGRLYDLPFGFPALVVPEEDVRAVGTDDPSHDAALQQRLAPQIAPRPDGPRVFGELFVFDRFDELLPALDRFEGFDPVADSGLYRRVLVPVETPRKTILAWVYAQRKPAGSYLPNGRWPA
jgi:gamma-glutamylcyclotransferase (GGCT)/AIG2-like uncharacterized protein YtfP